MVRFLVLYNKPEDKAFQSPEGQATEQDVSNFTNGGVLSMVYEVEEV